MILMGPSFICTVKTCVSVNITSSSLHTFDLAGTFSFRAADDDGRDGFLDLAKD